MGRGAAGWPKRLWRLKHSALGIDTLAVVGAAYDHRTHQGTGGRRQDRRRRACRAAEAHPRWPASGAHVAPRSLRSHASSHRGASGSSPMARAAVVAARRHGIMGAQGFVAPSLSKRRASLWRRRVPGCGRVRWISERSGDFSPSERETVTAMLTRSPAQGPEGMSHTPSATATKLSPPSTTWTCSKPL